LPGTLSRTFHQLDTRDLELIDGDLVERANIGDAVQRVPARESDAVALCLVGDHWRDGA
jgi:hypothetical protein